MSSDYDSMIGKTKVYAIHNGTLLSNDSYPPNARLTCGDLNNGDGVDTVIYKEGPEMAGDEAITYNTAMDGRVDCWKYVSVFDTVHHAHDDEHFSPLSAKPKDTTDNM